MLCVIHDSWILDRQSKSAIENLEWSLDERLRRLFAVAEAKANGHGGIALVWKATGIAATTTRKGLQLRAELDSKLYTKGIK